MAICIALLVLGMSAASESQGLKTILEATDDKVVLLSALCWARSSAHKADKDNNAIARLLIFGTMPNCNNS